MSSSEPLKTAPALMIPTWVAWGFSLLGATFTLLVMAADRRFNFGVEAGFAGLLLSAVGTIQLVLGFNGSAPSERAEPALFSKSLVWWLGTHASFFGVVWLAVQGLFPAHELAAGTLITGGFIACVVASFRLAQNLGFFTVDEDGLARPLGQRHGFWLLVLGAFLYLPTLGNFGLIDPWETHYGEVAREMLARDDWISLWWAQDGWFWSKPILNFWTQGLSFKVFGVHYMPDQMLAGVLQGRWPQPEWAARLPLFAMTVAAVHALYRSCVRPLGRRTAFLAGFVLLTCPCWFLLARQTMADMPYVAPVTAAGAFLLMGFQTAPDATVKAFPIRIGRWSLSLHAYHALFAVVLLTVLPQVLYLFSRNLTLHLGDPFGFRLHFDEIWRGSGGGNCGLPGNQSCAVIKPALKWGLKWGQPTYGALLWLSCLGAWLFLNRKERRTQRLMFLSAWFCTALAFMGKGAPGLVIPLAAALAYVGITGRFRELLRLEWISFLLLLLAVGLPWYVQMYMRHGFPFVERLVLHDMVKRAFDHVHDTNKGDDTSFRYYLWQLGYGLFPWTGFAAGGMLWALRRDQRARDARSDTALFFMIWWLVSFGMFSITQTKFHHYILPILPPTAVFAAILLARYLPARLPAPWTRACAYLGGMLGGVALSFFGIVTSLRGNILGSVYNGELGPSRPLLGTAMVLAGAALSVFVAKRWGPSLQPATTAPLEPQQKSSRVVQRAVFRNAALGVLALSAAVPVGLAGRDMFVSSEEGLNGQLRLLHLFTYNYDRVWPESVDFRATLLSFTVLCVAACLLVSIQAVRRHAGVVLCGAALCWTIWVTDIYLVVVSPHWGQRETILAYMESRANAKEPLVAYQMNWKGENFYTGNKMATFVSSGKKFERWVKKQRKQGVSTMFFTTEHSRVNGLKRELGKPKNFTLITSEKLNNKFTLAKVVFDPLPAGEDDDDDDNDDKKTAKSKAAGKPEPRPAPSQPVPVTTSAIEQTLPLPRPPNAAPTGGATTPSP